MKKYNDLTYKTLRTKSTVLLATEIKLTRYVHRLKTYKVLMLAVVTALLVKIFEALYSVDDFAHSDVLTTVFLCYILGTYLVIDYFESILISQLKIIDRIINYRSNRK